MPVISNTGTVVPNGIEQVVATIAGGPFDNVSAYVIGGNSADGGNSLLYKLYAVVGSMQSLVAETRVRGSAKASILQWQIPGSGAGGGASESVEAGGTSYALTVTAMPSPLPRLALTATLAGVNEFDVASNTNISIALAVAPFSESLTPNVNGFAQFMDVAVNQEGLSQSTTIIVYANNGSGSVEAVVAQVTLPGPDDITAVLRKVKLPVASVYRVGVRNNTTGPITVPISVATYSVVPISAGGVVALLGDVTGPSNANTVIRWLGVTLGPSMAVPNPGDVPFFSGGQWSAAPAGSTFALAGDVIGPAGSNTVQRWNNVPLDLATMAAPSLGAIPLFDGARWAASTGDITRSGLGANVVSGWDGVPLGPSMAAPGFADYPRFNGAAWETASSTSIPLGGPDVIGTLNANEVIRWRHVPLNAATFDAPVDAQIPIYDFDLTKEWRSISLSGDATVDHDGVVTVTGGTVTLTGNVNGPSGVNRFLALRLQGNDADVTVVETSGWTNVRMRGLTADRTVNLPAAPVGGEVVVVKDGDGSLATFDIIINSGANTIDEVASPYTMTAAQNSVKGSVQLYFESAAPAGWYLF